MCVIRQRRLITGLKISYQRRYNIYVLMKCQGKRCESSTDLPTVWWMKPIRPQIILEGLGVRRS